MSEKLELVTDFGKLKAGDLVVQVDCDFCGGRHRGILTRIDSDLGVDANGNPNDERGWELQPAACDGEELIILPNAVKDRTVYLVDTGLEQTSESHVERPKKLEGVR